MENFKTLDYKDAKLAISVIEKALLEKELAAVIAVADSSGELIGLLKVGNAPLPSIVIAKNKAWTAARERKKTKLIGDAVKDPNDGFDISYFGDNRYLGWGGGLPVLYNELVIGSVAVSRSPESVDIELAELGVDAILEKLKST